jgi:hypothetical protein
MNRTTFRRLVECFGSPEHALCASRNSSKEGSILVERTEDILTGLGNKRRPSAAGPSRRHLLALKQADEIVFLRVTNENEAYRFVMNKVASHGEG